MIYLFFPRLSYNPANDERGTSRYIEDVAELLQCDYSLIYGDELSGKTGLCRHVFLTLVDKAKPALYIDLDNVHKIPTSNVFREEYRRQFLGDYSSWEQQKDKTIILDNLTSQGIDYVILATEHFRRVIVTVSTDTFLAYFKDEHRLANFRDIRILSLTHGKQEKLIRKRVNLLNAGSDVSDGEIDHIENRVNTVIINNKILPRYPFFVLSILQTYEDFMPDNVSITSYGHCYYVLILSYLIKSGISQTDDEINASLNFLENMAFKIYNVNSVEQRIGSEALNDFFSEYKQDYIIKDSTLNRICGNDYGIITPSGAFKNLYMYYYFLGMYLAKNVDEHGNIIQEMLDRNYISSNF